LFECVRKHKKYEYVNYFDVLLGDELGLDFPEDVTKSEITRIKTRVTDTKLWVDNMTQWNLNDSDPSAFKE